MNEKKIAGKNAEKENAPQVDELEGLEFSVAEEAGFLPEVSEQDIEFESKELPITESVEGTELDAYESAQIEEAEFVEDERIDSIIESILFASDRPVSLNSIKLVFKGTNVKADKIRKALDRLAIEVAGARRGVSLEEVPGGYQLRTKIDNMQFLSKTLKARPFRLSGPALEVLAIVAYKQPMIKSEIDEIRGVESGHLLRALMEKNLIGFAGKSELPGKPMQYESTKKFLEIFSLRSLRELPTLSQIDELLPEGIGSEEEKGTGLSQLTDKLSENALTSYSQGEEELNKISDELGEITTSSDFFEKEKLKQKQKQETDKAQNIREAILMGEQVTTRDRNWLSRYDEAQMLGQKFDDPEAAVSTQAVGSPGVSSDAAVEQDEKVDEDDQLFSEESLEANDIADIDGEASV
jgi:segregation and condensation protein B